MNKSRLLLLVLVFPLFSLSCTRNPETASEEFTGKGEVASIDKETASVTIEHEEIKGLMSAMTMTFSAKERDLLNDFEKGDAVEFTLEKTDEGLTLIKIKKTVRVRADGAEIFKQSCAKCHGGKGEGAKKGIPLIEGHALNHPEEDFLKQVKEGGEKMPSFSDKLKDEEIAAVVRYVRDGIQKGLRKDDVGGHKH